MADPPWSFRSWSDKGKNRAPDAMVRQKGLAERHYATMGLADIKALPVADVAARDAVLFLWTVDCSLPDALAVGSSWGFEFKTVAVTWAKTNRSSAGWSIGLGYWTRGNPEEARERVEQLVPGPYLELFARSERPGWTSWGNQIGLFSGAANG